LEPAGAHVRGAGLRRRAAGHPAADRGGEPARGRPGRGGEPILNVLVTGAGGFLGRHVVAALLDRGHRIRGLIRPAARVAHIDWAGRVDVYRADLRAPGTLEAAFDGVDVLVHLAARVGGSDAAQMADTVVGTERLLEAMAGSATRKLVLASTFSV